MGIVPEEMAQAGAPQAAPAAPMAAPQAQSDPMSAPQVQTQPQGAQGPQGGVDPQRQQQYDILVTQALEYIHGKVLDTVVQRLQGAGDELPDVAGAMAGDVMVGQAVSAKGAGVELDRGAIFHATREVVGDLMEIAEAAGMEAPEEEVNLAFVAAIDRIVTGGQQAGLFTEQEVASAQQYVSSLQAKGQELEGMQGMQPQGAPSAAQPAPMAQPAPAMSAAQPPQQPGIVPEGMA